MSYTCKSCGDPIEWQKTLRGRGMPVNPGYVSIVTDGGNVVRGRVSHFATCPQADEHRKPRSEGDE